MENEGRVDANLDYGLWKSDEGINGKDGKDEMWEVEQVKESKESEKVGEDGEELRADLMRGKGCSFDFCLKM